MDSIEFCLFGRWASMWRFESAFSTLSTPSPLHFLLFSTNSVKACQVIPLVTLAQGIQIPGGGTQVYYFGDRKVRLRPNFETLQKKSHKAESRPSKSPFVLPFKKMKLEITSFIRKRKTTTTTTTTTNTHSTYGVRGNSCDHPVIRGALKLPERVSFRPRQ